MPKGILRAAVPIAIILFTAIIVAGIFLARPQTTPTNSVRPAPRIQVVTLRQEAIEPVLELYGTVESPQKVEIESPVTTYVLATPFLEGDIVSKGQSLLTLDQRDPKLLVQTRQGDVDELNAQIASEAVRYQTDLAALAHDKELVKLKQNNVEREKHLAQRQYGSPQRVEAAEQELENQKLTLTARELAIKDHQNRASQLQARLARARAQLEQAQLDLQRAQIPAPFDGRITALRVAVGDRVTSGQALIELFNTQEVELRAQVPHRAVGYLDRVLHAQAELSAWAEIHEQRFELKLDRLASEINSRRAGVDALFSVDERDAYLALGHTVPVFLRLTPRDDVFAVPVTSIYDEQRIYRVVDHKIERVLIERVGYSLDKQGQRLSLVKSDKLKAGDQVMISQLPQIADGMRVEVVADGRDAADKPRQVGVSTPQVGVSTPQVGVSTPQVGVSTPQGDVSTPQVGVSTPQQEAQSTAEGAAREAESSSP